MVFLEFGVMYGGGVCLFDLVVYLVFRRGGFSRYRRFCLFFGVFCFFREDRVAK